MKMLVSLYYVGTLCIVVNYVLSRWAHPWAIVWVLVLVIIPAMVFLRMRSFVPALWRTVPTVAVYVPLDFVGYVRPSGPHGLSEVFKGSHWAHLLDPQVSFSRLGLALPPYLLLAIIAAVLLTHLNGWSLRGASKETRQA